jgi:antitoxin CcdA
MCPNLSANPPICPSIAISFRKARDLKINLSRAAEEGIERAVKVERERLWRIENAEAIAASNKYVEQHGLPLAKYRQF